MMLLADNKAKTQGNFNSWLWWWEKKGPFFYSKTLRIKRKIKIKPKRETLEFVEIVLCFLHFLYFLYFMYFFMIIWDNTRYGDLLAARLDNEPNGSTISYI